MKQEILNTVDDLVSSFLYYDRKEDEDLPLGKIEKAINDGTITEVEIVHQFAVCLAKGIGR